MSNAFSHGLDRNDANFAALTPISFLNRAAFVFPDKPSVVHGARRFTWKETAARCRRLASALHKRGIGGNDTVAAMLPNIPAMYEAHFGVAMAGAVLNTLNTRLDAEAIAFMLDHGEAKVLLTDREFSKVVAKALDADLRPKTDGHRRRRCNLRRRRIFGRDRVRGFPQRGRRGFPSAKAWRRMGRHLAQLHVGHHRQSQGRGLSSSRRLSERHQQHRVLGHAAACGLSLDAADVPLQRLVLSLDDSGQRRRQRLPAPGRRQNGVRPDSRPKKSRTCAARPSSTACSSTTTRKTMSASTTRSRA